MTYTFVPQKRSLVSILLCFIKINYNHYNMFSVFFKAVTQLLTSIFQTSPKKDFGGLTVRIFILLSSIC